MGSAPDFFDAPLAEILLDQNGRIARLEDEAASLREALERYDEGLSAVEWWIARHVGAGHRAMSPEAMLRVLGEVTHYANTGRRPAWLDSALDAMREGRL